MQKGLVATRGSLDGFVTTCLSEIQPDSLVDRTMRWVAVVTRDPDIVAGEDDDHLRHVWSAKILSLWRRIDETRRRIERLEGLEQRQDDAVLRLASWIGRDFKQPAPAWKGSGAAFKGFDDGGLVFLMFFFVDNIELEHFWRQVRVEGELRREGARRLRPEGIGVATPHYEVSFRQGVAIAPGSGSLAGERRPS